MNENIDLSNSRNIPQEKMKQLQQLFPEAFSDGKLDLERLKLALGEEVFVKDEHYELSWAGKSEAFKVLQQPTTATLAPCPDESVNFDTTENIFIEGENLEVLKILQKSYFGKIKMIYIDPPYNRGTDSFIYPDKFSESKEEYLKRIGSKDEEGYLTKEGYFRKNSKDNGHYHSNWLTMMYPRLYLARNLLLNEGVICISIGDDEVQNLRCIMDEIFGEDNYEGHIHWRRRHNQPNDPTKMIGLVAEHILVYAKDSKYLKQVGVGKLDLTGNFTNPDNDPKGDWASKPWKVGSGQTGSKYEIVTPTGKTYNEEWMGDIDTYKDLLNEKRIIFPDNENGPPRKKYYKFERQEEGQCATNWWHHDIFGHNQEATTELEHIFGSKQIFDNPKPTRLMKNLIKICNCKDGDIIFDFFAGSSTLAHAAFSLSKEEKISTNFICTQFPEKINENEEAFTLGYSNIAQVSSDRIKKVIEIMIAEDDELFFNTNPDLGFKYFRMKYSNFKLWRGDIIESEEDLNNQIDAFDNPLLEKTREMNVLYELMLKSGYLLTDKVEKPNGYYSIKSNELIVVLEALNADVIKEIIDAKPQKVIILDSLFADDDQFKTNTALQMKDAGIEFRAV